MRPARSWMLSRSWLFFDQVAVTIFAFAQGLFRPLALRDIPHQADDFIFAAAHEAAFVIPLPIGHGE